MQFQNRMTLSKLVVDELAWASFSYKILNKSEDLWWICILAKIHKNRFVQELSIPTQYNNPFLNLIKQNLSTSVKTTETTDHRTNSLKSIDPNRDVQRRTGSQNIPHPFLVLMLRISTSNCDQIVASSMSVGLGLLHTECVCTHVTSNCFAKFYSIFFVDSCMSRYPIINKF